MPHSFFILYRLFLRVDNVLFRMYDIRIFHAFGTDEVIREVCGMEADYEAVKAVSPPRPFSSFSSLPFPSLRSRHAKVE